MKDALWIEPRIAGETGKFRTNAGTQLLQGLERSGFDNLSNRSADRFPDSGIDAKVFVTAHQLIHALAQSAYDQSSSPVCTIFVGISFLEGQQLRKCGQSVCDLCIAD